MRIIGKIFKDIGGVINIKFTNTKVKDIFKALAISRLNKIKYWNMYL